jgi:predicted dehydrogenase/threonine dehydrogenase-like Zn-dependent dehydrogenase
VRTAASLLSAGTERMLVEFAGKSLIGKARSRPDLVRQAIDKARREGLLTTLESAFNRLDQPMPLGYSSAGTVASVGEGLSGFQEGDRVACAGGGFAVHAEYAVVPRNLLARLPEEVDFESAAFTTLGAIAMHGFRLSHAALGERVAVIGLGLLGLLAVQIARAAGCKTFGVDLDPTRVALANQLGVDAVQRDQAEQAAQSFSCGAGLDVVLICADTSSADPVELAGTIARDRASVVAVGAVGLSLPRKLYYEKELSFVNSRSYGPGRYDPHYEEGGVDYPPGYVRWTEGRNLQAFVDLLAQGLVDVKPLITHRFPIDEAPKAYDLIAGERSQPSLGVLLTYPTTSSTLSVPSPVSIAESYRPSTGIRTPAGGVRLGVLGAGNFASAVMLPALAKIPAVERIAIASGSGLNAQHAADKYGFHYAGEEQRILTDPEVNTVAILTRHNLHARQVIAALQAGKHVFCEKPLALTLEELAQVQDALQSAASNAAAVAPLLTVGYNRRFAPLAVELREFIAARGSPLYTHYRVNAGYLPLNHWLHDPQQGGGRLIGEGCHFIDFLTFLVGEPPLSVRASGLPDDGRYREDNLLLTLTFPDGSIGVISYLANGDKAFPKERVEVFCEGRVAVLDDFRTLETVSNGKRQVSHARLRQDKGHRHEWQAFLEAITTSGEPPIPYQQIFAVSKASFAALLALRQGHTVALADLPASLPESPTP